MIKLPYHIYNKNDLPKHLRCLFEYLMAEVYSPAGDRDVLIIMKYYDANNISNLFYEFIKEKQIGDNFFFDKIDNNTFAISDHSTESWTFTNNLAYEPPVWDGCIVKI